MKKARVLKWLAIISLLVAAGLTFMPIVVPGLPPPPRPVVSLQERGTQKWEFTTGPLMDWVVSFEALMDTCTDEERKYTCSSRFILSVQDAQGNWTTFRCDTGSEEPSLQDSFATVPPGFQSIKIEVDILKQSSGCGTIPIRVRPRGPTVVFYCMLWFYSLPVIVLSLLMALWAFRASRKAAGTPRRGMR